MLYLWTSWLNLMQLNSGNIISTYIKYIYLIQFILKLIYLKWKTLSYYSSMPLPLTGSVYAESAQWCSVVPQLSKTYGQYLDVCNSVLIHRFVSAVQLQKRFLMWYSFERVYLAKMEEKKSILHELYVFSEWKPEPEYIVSKQCFFDFVNIFSSLIRQFRLN